MVRNTLFGLTAGVALAALASGAFAQTSDQPANKGQGQDQVGKQQQEGGRSGAQQGSRPDKDQHPSKPGFGAGVGGDTSKDQNVCECPCGTPGAKPRGSFGSGLPGTQGTQQGTQGTQQGTQGTQQGTQGTQQGGGR